MANSNEQPAVNASQARDIDENVVPPAALGVALGATDPDGTTAGMTWRIDQDEDETNSDHFTIDSSTGVLSICDPVAPACAAPAAGYDFEGDVTGLRVAVVAIDAGGLESEPEVVSVEVRDLNEDPALADVTITVPERSPAGMLLQPKLKGTDPDTRVGAVQGVTGGVHADLL